MSTGTGIDGAPDGAIQEHAALLGYRSSDYLLLTAVVATILFYRYPDRFLSGYLWAEDGTQFLRAAYESGWSSLWQQYQGYLHLLPRLLALSAAATVSIQKIPYVLPVLSAAVTCAGALVIFAGASDLPWRSKPSAWSFGMALAPFVVPHGGEVMLSITNLQWLMAPVLLAVLYAAPRTGPRIALPMALLAFVLSLTGPFSIMLAPIVVAVGALRAKALPSRRAWLVYGAYVAGTLIQAATLLRHLDRTPVTPTPVSLSYALVYELLAPALLPEPLVQDYGLVAVIAVVVACILFAASIARSPKNLELLAALAFGLLIWVAGAIKWGGDYSFSWVYGGARYMLMAYVAIMWGVIVAAGTSRSVCSGGTALPLVMTLVLVSASHFVELRVEPTSVKVSNGGYEIRYPPGYSQVLKSGRLPVRDDNTVFPKPVDLITRSPIRGDCNIENVNGLDTANDSVSVQSSAMQVKGWAALSGAEGRLADDVSLALTAADGRTYSVPVMRTRRADVAARFKHSTVAEAGFEAVIDLVDLPDRFELQVVQKEGDQNFVCGQRSVTVIRAPASLH